MHPFEIKTIYLAKHAQHVVLIHFPIALFIIGVLFDFLSQWKKHYLLAAAAYYNLLVAAIATIPTVVPDSLRGSGNLRHNARGRGIESRTYW